MPPVSDRPNVLLLLTDDQRFDAVAALGDPAFDTPNLDRLVAEGCACADAHIPGGSVPAVCMPSRAMLHTGRSLYELESAGESIPDEHHLMGECFRSAGYATFGTGKWHNGTGSFARSFSDGAEIFFGGMDDHWNVPVCDYDPSGRYEGRLPTVRDPFKGKAQIDRPGDRIHAGHHSTDLFTDATLAFLDRRPKDRPFFAYTSFMAPHDPRVMPKRFLDAVQEADVELPPNFAPEHPYDTGFLNGRDENLAAKPRTPGETREHIRDYRAMVAHIDEAVGRILDRLEADGLRENTIIVFAGDNGLAVGQHGLMGKQSLYEHSVRVPLIFAGPGLPKGERRKGICTLSDVFPTLCRLCGLDTPETASGNDLSEWLKNEAKPVREGLYLSYAGSIRGLTDRHWKLIEYADGATQLFDLEADPFETRNLAADPEKRNRLHDLRARLREAAKASGEAKHPLAGEFWARRNDL